LAAKTKQQKTKFSEPILEQSGAKGARPHGKGKRPKVQSKRPSAKVERTDDGKAQRFAPKGRRPAAKGKRPEADGGRPPAKASDAASKEPRLAGNNKRLPAKGGTSAAGVSFAGLLLPLVPPAPEVISEDILHSSPLAHLDYGAELAIKNEGLAAYWNKHRLAGSPESIVASPRPRGYRTTSKRRGFLQGSTLYLLFGDHSKWGRPEHKKSFLASPLEPVEHERIYRFLQKKLSEGTYRLIAGHLNYLIIRGSYEEMAVIFNVDMMNGPLVRKLKMLAVHLQKLAEPIVAASAYLDPSKSDYYLESRRPSEGTSFKKLFGPDQLAVSHGGCRYLFHPTSFSQVNESMVEEMLTQARLLLAPDKKEQLLDLYCGYGLFSHFLAQDYKQVLAIDAEGPSIRSAVANTQLNKERGGAAKFLARRITRSLFEKGIPAASGPEAVLLDPPRQGPMPGVIKAICKRRPKKILHIFCGVDQIPASLKEWQANGFKVSRIVPLDMFPGSANLEVLVLLVPRQ